MFQGDFRQLTEQIFESYTYIHTYVVHACMHTYIHVSTVLLLKERFEETSKHRNISTEK